MSVDELLAAELASNRSDVSYDVLDLMVELNTQTVSAAVVGIEGGDGDATYALPWTSAWADNSTGAVRVSYTVQQAMSYGPFGYEG